MKVRIKGRGMERFFNIAAQRDLTVEKIETQERKHQNPECNVPEHENDCNGMKNVSFLTTPDDFKRMKPIARKTNVRLRITEKHGIPFWILLGRKRCLWVGGVCAFFLLLYVSSLYVWDISFDGNYRFTDQMLLHFMEEIPVRCGMRKSRISCEDLENTIRNAFPEIGWVSAELTGTRLTVHIRENRETWEKKEEMAAPCELTAKKDGTVRKIVVRSGISKIQTGDQVKEGDVLVSGEIPIYDDSETLVRTHKIHADGEIFAETTENIVWSADKTKEIRAETGRKRYGIFLKILDGELCFLMPDFKKTQSWEIVMQEYQMTLSKNFVLPVWFGVLTAKEYAAYEKVLTETEVSETAERYLNEYMENLTEKGIQILGSDVKIERSESDWKIHGTLTVVEDIAEESPIPENQEEIQTVDEHH